MLSVVTWKWTAPGGPSFGPEYVNRLRAGLARHLHLPHQLWCITDEAQGIDPRVRIVPLPQLLSTSPRCRRRMRIFDRAFAAPFGDRILTIDLDVVIVDDLTPILDRPEPLVCWLVRHAHVFSGSFHLQTPGVLQGLWDRFAADPDGYPRLVQPHGVASDQAMLNHYLRTQPAMPYWTEADGFVTYFGKGYETRESFGVGPTLQRLPLGARIVVLGSADKRAMDTGAYPWIREHWSALEAVAS